MSAAPRQSWTAIAEEVSRRIAEGEWPTGEMIPNEAALAAEFGCSRSTVNRALQSLAEQGLLERKRKAGTMVRALPDSRARLEIPVVRRQVERRGARHGYSLIAREEARPPAAIAARMALAPDAVALHLISLHTADGAPFVAEDRWINLGAVPGAARADFTVTNANEWLVKNVPLSTGEILLSAAPAGPDEARLLGCGEGAALFVQERLTEYGGATITFVRLAYAPGYAMRLAL